MKFYYPVCILQESPRCFRAVFPDLEGCTAAGESLEEVLERAADAAEDWIRVEMQEEVPQLPSATDPADLRPGPQETIRMILVRYRFTDGWEE